MNTRIVCVLSCSILMDVIPSPLYFCPRIIAFFDPHTIHDPSNYTELCSSSDRSQDSIQHTFKYSVYPNYCQIVACWSISRSKSESIDKEETVLEIKGKLWCWHQTDNGHPTSSSYLGWQVHPFTYFVDREFLYLEWLVISVYFPSICITKLMPNQSFSTYTLISIRV